MGCLGIEIGQHQDELYWKIRRGGLVVFGH
jgi:hypothetical protein